MSSLELAAVAFGIANIVLLVRRSIWNYPFGMAMVALYALIFFRAKLYGEAGLQVFFFVVNAYGWALWHRAKGEDAPVAVRWLSWPARAAWLLGTAAVALNLGWVMHRFTDAALPFADASVTGMSIAAQFLLSYRRIENWVLWIVIDCVSVGLYVIRGLHLTAGLYVLFLALSVLGLREWIAASKAQGK